MISALEHSYAYCTRLAQRTAKNFYYAFLALPPTKRRAMCALYAFLRISDDIGDGAASLAERRCQLAAWRSSLSRALQGQYDHPLLAALHHTISHCAIPPDYLYGVLDGVEMDLGPVRYQTFEELYRYCYQVASIVGLACIHIWGFRGRTATTYACHCGIAFQLTNILRDLKEDGERGRVYIPQEDLERFGYAADELRAGRLDGRYRRLMQFQVQRARDYYRDGARLLDCLEPVGRPVFRTMHGIYSALLQEIERRSYDVFSCRVALSSWRKASILLQSVVGLPRAIEC